MPAHLVGSVAGVVLAAGASTRMGRNKLFLALEGETVLRRAARRAVEANLDPVIVVLGHEAERAVGELSGLPCRAVVNPDYASGQTTSLRTGIAALPATAEAAVVMLADMPFVTSDMLATVVRRYHDSGAPLVISDFDGVTAPPMLYRRSLFPDVQAMEGDGCGKWVVRSHRGEAAVVSWPGEALSDLDVPDDYERAQTRLATK